MYSFKIKSDGAVIYLYHGPIARERICPTPRRGADRLRARLDSKLREITLRSSDVRPKTIPELVYALRAVLA